VTHHAVQKHKGRTKKEPVQERDLKWFRKLHRFTLLLSRLHFVADHHNRQLHYDQYIALHLLYFFNPILSSLRGIQHASHLKKVQNTLAIRGTSMGALSEAAHVFDAQLLKPFVAELAQKAAVQERDPKLRSFLKRIVAVDGTLLPALPRMAWALWVDDTHRAAKLHLELDILKHTPVGAVVTDGNANEKTVLRSVMSKDTLYVLDAGFAEYKLFQDILDAGSSFIARLRDNAVWETLHENLLTAEDQKAGVLSDTTVHLGSKQKQDSLQRPVRVIRIFHRGDSRRHRKSRVCSKGYRTTEVDYEFLVATDIMDMSAEMAALIFQYRWQVEIFFRWLKCILGMRHLLSDCRNGVTIQVYCALIASMLLSLWTGRKPSKRTFEMLCFYFMGWADEDEVEAHLLRLKKAEAKKNVSLG
jgi:hypothetical protein